MTMTQEKLKKMTAQKDEKYKEKFNVAYEAILDFYNETSSRFFQKRDLLEALQEVGDDTTEMLAEVDTLREISERAYASREYFTQIKNNLL